MKKNIYIIILALTYLLFHLLIIFSSVGSSHGTDITRLEEQLILHEGFRAMAYHDTVGVLTVGIGRNIEDRGITRDEAIYLLRNDIKECTEDLCDIFDNFGSLSENRRFALIDMRFNLGYAGFRQFTKLISAVRCGNFPLAASEMRNSLWFIRGGVRGERLVDMMLEEK